jgi:pilus assembly protein CpaF
MGDGAGELGPLMVELHERLAELFDRDDLQVPAAYLPGQPVDEITWQRAESAVREALKGYEASGRLPGGADPTAIASTVVSEALALGPITALLDDPGVQRILVNGAQRIFVTRGGRTEQVPARFSGNMQVLAVVDRLLRGAGVHVPPGSQFAEGYLPDGARIHAALPSVGGPFVTIERPAAQAATLDDLVGREVLSRNAAGFLELAVRAGRRVLVSGNDVDARAELVGAMLGSGAGGLRVVAVEGGGRLGGQNLVTLSAAPGADGPILVQQALKMRPDRLVVLDVRGPEAFYALTGLLGGVNGGILGVDAESPDDALARLVRLAGLAIHASDDRLESLVRDAGDVLVQITRYADGRTRVTRVVDLDGGEMQDVFGANSRATGHVPRFVSEAQSLGHSVDLNLFR